MSAKAALFAVMLLPVVSIASAVPGSSPSQQDQIGLHERLAQQYLKQQTARPGDTGVAEAR